MIHLDGVTVTVRARAGAPRTILDGVDMTIARGEWVALAGANGAGKSTLLKAIASLIPLARGTVSFDDSPPPRVGMLLQEPDNQLVASSVHHELALSVAGRDADPAAAAVRVADARDRFGLARLWERNPHALSGGEKQRVALAGVWLEEPGVVLLDEPTAFLDPPMTRRCVDFVGELRARGAAVVWTASRESDLEHADSVAFLDDGRLAFRGSIGDYRSWSGRAALSPRRATARTASPPAGADAAIVFDGVSLSYGDVDVFDGLDLTVRAGECVGVSGNNGSGKSSLLLLAGGAVAPTRGRVTTPAARNRGAFFLPQSPERMFFAETVEEELAFGLRRQGVRGDEAAARCAAALSDVGLDPRVCLAQSPFDLSPGEMRRVAFAVAMVLEPALLLLDEPTAGLDPDGVGELYRLLERCRAGGTTVIIASHDAPFLTACDRVVELPGRDAAL